MKLHSQEVRKLAPENDPLKIGMGWSVADLDKPQILVESSFGDSHPGSAHLNQFVEEGVKAVNDNGGKAARYYVTDICDGIAQGHDGINYSLAHRDMMTNMIEVHGMASGFDGGMFIASCDKSVPAILMGIGRLKDMSAIVVTGGVMEAALRSAHYLVTGRNPDPDAFKIVRSPSFETGVVEAEVQIGDATIRAAVVSGLGNVRKLLEAIEHGEVHYDFVEVMACPGGCVGGGGQPIHDGEELAHTRGANLYFLDKNAKIRFSHENQDVMKLYNDFLEKPLSHKSHMLLHTDHTKWDMPR